MDISESDLIECWLSSLEENDESDDEPINKSGDLGQGKLSPKKTRGVLIIVTITMKGMRALPKPEHAMVAKKIYMTGTVAGGATK